jgi:glycogen debranching enzyme
LQPTHRPLVPSMAHAIFFDQTHDNPSPFEKRSGHDLLPSSALVSMTCCASGSNKGYDEMVPHHIHVVSEKRTYAGAKEATTGMVKARKALNDIHFFLGKNGYSEIYVDQMNFDVVAVTRHNPATHESVVAVSHTMFSKGVNPDNPTHVQPVRVEGLLEEIVLGRDSPNS